MNRRRTWPGAVAGVAMMVVTTVAAIGPATAGQPAAGNCVVTAAYQAIDSVELQLANLVNDYRAQNGRARLPLHQDLNRAAAWMSRDMATNNRFDASNHIDSNGRAPAARFTWCGVEWTALRENIAAHTSGQAQDIFNLWLNSPPHVTNMLATDVNFMGIGRAFNAAADFDWYFTNTFGKVQPVPVSDFDGDGATDVAVFRNGGWYVRYGAGGGESPVWGQNGDIPVPADYNGDGKTDMAVFRNGVWYIRYAGGTNESTAWGQDGDVPVPGDYNGDAATDVAVFRNGVWYVRYAMGGGESPVWGVNGDVPVPGDYNGDGKTDMAVFRNGVWYIRYASGGSESLAWGANGDIPVPGDYNGDGRTDVAVFRPTTGVWYIRYASGGNQSPAWGQNGDIPLALPHALRKAAGLPV